MCGADNGNNMSNILHDKRQMLEWKLINLNKKPRKEA